jgi:MFS transporter, ACS family, tartrate transporter
MDAGLETGVAVSARRKTQRRILPFLFLLYVVAYLDRANVAFVSALMRAELGFDEAVFGLGTGIFFIGYFVLEIPGALIVERWSARKWLARILITWGLCTMLIAGVKTPLQFYSARFLLGVAEAGFLPGVIVYLTHWFPAEERARALSRFAIAAPAALTLGAPLSALILQIHALGISGWRWVFLLEGVPAIVLGVATLIYLTDYPREARWLTEPERQWLTGRLAVSAEGAAPVAWWRALWTANIARLTLAAFFANIAGYGFLLWLPNTLQKTLRIAPTYANLISALPFAAAIFMSLLAGKSSDVRNERKGHACLAFLAGALFLTLIAIPNQPPLLVLLWIVLTGASIYSWIPPFWVLPTILLGKDAAAASVGFINSIGNLGGFVGPYFIGSLLSRGWTPARSTSLLAMAYVASAVLTWSVRLGSASKTAAPHGSPITRAGT